MKQENLSELWLVLLTTLIENLEITSDFQKICLQVRFSPSCLLKSSSTEKLTFTRVVPSPVFLLGTRREKKKRKKMRARSYYLPRAESSPSLGPGWFSSKRPRRSGSNRLIVQTGENTNQPDDQRVALFAALEEAGWRPRPIPLLPPSLPRLAVNETLPGSVTLTLPSLSHHHPPTPHTHLC